MNELKLNDIITIDFQNEIQDSFSLATGFGVVFTDAEGNHIGSKRNFCKFCDKINQTEKGAFYCSCTNRNAIAMALETKKPSIYICHAGLVNIEIPLIHNDKCIGAITAGNVLCAEGDIYPREPAPKGINWLEDPGLAADYQEIPVMSREQIEGTATALASITNYIIQTAVNSQMQEDLARKNAELLEAETRRSQLEQQLKIAQLDALQKQVTPHFIFNVINSISRLMSLEEYDTAGDMLDSFSQMMRYSLANIRSSVTLQQELDYINNYLSIQKIRFGNRIDYEIKCDPAISTMFIPFFALQPLVENALEHGLLNQPLGGKVTLSCSSGEDFTTIKITDNGGGISADQLKNLRRCLDDTETVRDQQHIGLYNCCQRFRLMFGQSCVFNLESSPGKGTRITIGIPHASEYRKSKKPSPGM